MIMYKFKQSKTVSDQLPLREQKPSAKKKKSSRWFFKSTKKHLKPQHDSVSSELTSSSGSGTQKTDLGDMDFDEALLN